MRQGVSTDLPDWLNDAAALHDIIRLTGWTPEQIDEQPAALLDALRAVDRVNRGLEREREAALMRALRGG